MSLNPCACRNVRTIRTTSGSSIKALLELAIKNEGTVPWEYIYNWRLVKLDKAGNETEEIQRWTASKYLKEGEKTGIPIQFKDLSAGKYSFNVNVDYGEYTSKAQVSFEIEAQQRLTARANNIIWSGKYYIATVATMAVLLYLITKQPEIKRFRRPPMQPNR